MSKQKIEIESALNEIREDIQGIYLGNGQIIDEILLNVKQRAVNYLSIDDFKRKVSIDFLKEISVMLKNDELNHRDFFLEGLKNNEFWKPLAKLVLLKRIEELKKCKILRKGKKYDVSGLKDTFFGKYIMEQINFERRSVLNEEEYTKITNAIKKLNYELPVVIQPTETERFFK